MGFKMRIRLLLALAAVAVLALIFGGQSHADKLSEVALTKGGGAAVDVRGYYDWFNKCAGNDLPVTGSAQASVEISKLAPGDYLCSGQFESNRNQVTILKIEGCVPFPANLCPR
jgi:hypothetical protein